MSAKKLQIKVNGVWKYVFCYNEIQGVITTKNKCKAVKGKNALEYFESKNADQEFRLI